MTQVGPTASPGAFELPAFPTRVTFGRGSRNRLPEVLDRVGIDRLMLIGSRRALDQLGESLDPVRDRVVATVDQVRPHVPVEAVEATLGVVAQQRPTGCLAVGGGSAIGLAKAVALRGGLPYVAVPSTYAGSEMTSVWGMTRDGVKRTGRDVRVRPSEVVYDADLADALDQRTAVLSGLNALAHAAEAAYAPDTSPLVQLVAQEAAGRLVGALRVIANGSPAGQHDAGSQAGSTDGDHDARSAALYGAALCGYCLGVTTMSLHHKICHVLGGAFDLPHAETHAVLLPHVLDFLLPAAPTAEALLRDALDGGDVVGAIWSLGLSVGATSLGALGLETRQVPGVVDQVLTELGTQQTSPRTVGRRDLHDLLIRATEGADPVRIPIG